MHRRAPRRLDSFPTVGQLYEDSIDGHVAAVDGFAFKYFGCHSIGSPLF
jgi:hypothetical protein